MQKNYNALESEAKWQNYWDEIGIHNFNPNATRFYSIDTPPPTVNGKIHIGHVFSYSQVEMIARYWRMKGYEIFYPFGFDDNGLPTERLVEKQYKLRAHDLPREEFIKLCLKTTAEYEEQFKALFRSLGFSVDWSLEYSTISPLSQKTSQKSFIDLYQKQKAYYSESPALWCTECRTSIAQAEIETRVLDSSFNYMKFTIAGSDEALLIATTRPELLSGCVCIFINPNDKEKMRFIGKEAIVPLFDYKVPIMADEKVEMDKGSGIVMCCTFGDLTDLELWKKYNLPLKKVITKEGKIAGDIPFYGNMKISEARSQTIKDLEARGYLIKSEPLQHNVAVHERCQHPIEITISNQWFISILKEKDKYLDAGNKIKWYPVSMKERYMNWVENLQWDWCISRQRYFGVPFPVWYCSKCGAITVADESELPVNPVSTSPKQKCACGSSEFIPETDVMDTWATSSVTPLINTRWIEKENLLDKIMPMTLRPNSHDIIRTWDFYTIVKNLYHLGILPWGSIMISGFVLAGKGEKISKSKGNAVHSPEEVIQTYSADVVRYWAASGRLGTDLVFSEDELKNGRKLITKIWNASKFALMHLEGFTPDAAAGLLPMDRWILSKLSKYAHEMREYLDKYEVGLALYNLEKFFWNFCDNYIEIVKDRLYKPEFHGAEAKLSGQNALYLTLLNLLKFFAIYFPHITEEIYQSYFAGIEGFKSIHISRIDAFDYEVDDKLIKNGDLVVEIISSVRKFKSENNLSLKTELNSISIGCEPDTIVFLKTVENDVKATCTCQTINYFESKALEVQINLN